MANLIDPKLFQQGCNDPSFTITLQRLVNAINTAWDATPEADPEHITASFAEMTPEQLTSIATSLSDVSAIGYWIPEKTYPVGAICLTGDCVGTGGLWQCLSTCTGVYPTFGCSSAVYWSYIGNAKDTKWHDNVTYLAGDIVTYGDPLKAYMALMDASNQAPTTLAPYWQLLIPEVAAVTVEEVAKLNIFLRNGYAIRYDAGADTYQLIPEGPVDSTNPLTSADGSVLPNYYDFVITVGQTYTHTGAYGLPKPGKDCKQYVIGDGAILAGDAVTYNAVTFWLQYVATIGLVNATIDIRGLPELDLPGYAYMQIIISQGNIVYANYPPDFDGFVAIPADGTPVLIPYNANAASYTHVRYNADHYEVGNVADEAFVLVSAGTHDQDYYVDGYQWPLVTSLDAGVGTLTAVDTAVMIRGTL